MRDRAQAAVPATADEGEEVLKRTDINRRIKWSHAVITFCEETVSCALHAYTTP